MRRCYAPTARMRGKWLAQGQRGGLVGRGGGALLQRLNARCRRHVKPGKGQPCWASKSPVALFNQGQLSLCEQAARRMTRTLPRHVLAGNPGACLDPVGRTPSGRPCARSAQSESSAMGKMLRTGGGIATRCAVRRSRPVISAAEAVDRSRIAIAIRAMRTPLPRAAMPTIPERPPVWMHGTRPQPVDGSRNRLAPCAGAGLNLSFGSR